MTDIIRIAAFSDGDQGGNPAGVVIASALPPASDMQRIAAEVGYSETVFACPQEKAWRARYFAPETEVPFCGHATIALGAALAMQEGGGVFDLVLNEAEITVEGHIENSQIRAALQSPPTHSNTPSAEQVAEALVLFGYIPAQVNSDLPPMLIHGGADHLAITLNSRAALSDMDYDLDAGRALMNKNGWVTITLAYSETPNLFHTRNPFASGGVHEDPATGAATAAFAGYLRDSGWMSEGAVDFIQGVDMGQPSRLRAEYSATPNSSIRVSGQTRVMA